MADEQRMPYRQYAKFEKIFFLYGSTVKMLEPVRLNEWMPVPSNLGVGAEKVSNLVDEYTEGFLEPPPRVRQDVGAPAAETPDELEPPNGNTPEK